MAEEKLFKPEDFDKPGKGGWYKSLWLWLLLVALIVAIVCVSQCSRAKESNGTSHEKSEQVVSVVQPQENNVTVDANATQTSEEVEDVVPEATSSNEIQAVKEDKGGVSNAAPVVVKSSSLIDVELEAKKVIRGDYGNGIVRKKELEDNYQQVQSVVNRKMREGDIYWD